MSSIIHARLVRGENAPGSGPTRRIAIRNSPFDDVGTSTWGGGGRLLQLLNGVAVRAFEHKTCLHTGNIVTAEVAVHDGIVGGDESDDPPGNYVPRSLDPIGFGDKDAGVDYGQGPDGTP